MTRPKRLQGIADFHGITQRGSCGQNPRRTIERAPMPDSGAPIKREARPLPFRPGRRGFAPAPDGAPRVIKTKALSWINASAVRIARRGAVSSAVEPEHLSNRANFASDRSTGERNARAFRPAA
jgi:hypothetical protein